MINTLPSTGPTGQKQRYTAIPLRTLFHIAWSNITHKKLRSVGLLNI